MSNDKSKPGAANISRRSFLKGAGVTSVGVLASESGLLKASEDAGDGKLVGPEKFSAFLKINGKTVKVEIEPRTTLAQVLRDQLSLTGTKVACNRGACGACTVIVAGKAVSSCMTLAIDVLGLDIETIEGKGKEYLQRAFVEHDALQCGFCTSGMIMSCKSLLDNNPNPTHEQIRSAVSGNICRCGSYPKVFDAVKAAKENKR